MDALPWFWIWILLAALLFIGEMFSLSFFMLPFGVGAVVSAIANAFSADIVVQWVLFVVISIAALFALRPVANHLTKRSDVKSGVERLIGCVGEVIEGNAPEGLIRIRVEREEWNASLESGGSGGSRLSIGSSVEVTGIEGTRLIVKELGEQTGAISIG